MKKSKLFLGLAVLLIAVAGAFASKANTLPETYWYYDNDGRCQSQEFNFECVLGTPTCEGFIILEGVNKPLFASFVSEFECEGELQED